MCAADPKEHQGAMGMGRRLVSQHRGLALRPQTQHTPSSDPQKTEERKQFPNAQGTGKEMKGWSHSQ